MAFDKRSIQRINDAVNYVERISQSNPPGSGIAQGKPPFGNAAAIRVAVVKTTITARSGSTPGHGTVTFKYIEDGVYVNGEDNVEVFSSYSVSLAVGRWLTIGYSGTWTVLGDDCPTS